MKVCSKCNIEKDFNCFFKDRKSKDGFSYYCSKCKYVANKNSISKRIRIDIKEKQCIGCLEILNIEQFTKNPSCIDGRNVRCRKCFSPINKEYFYKRKYGKGNLPLIFFKLSSFWRKAKRLYGITTKEINDFYLKANGFCDCCKKQLGKYIDLDHCHSTGKVRGVVCRRCNLRIGFRESGDHNLVDKYLKFHRSL